MTTKPVPGLGEKPVLSADAVPSDVWLARMQAADRLCDTRIEVVDSDLSWVQDVTPDGGSITMTGDAISRYKATLSWVSDYPVDWTDLLHPLSGNRIRIWWQEWVPEVDAWVEVLLMTGWPEDPDADLDPGLSWSGTLLDVLGECQRSDYSQQSIDVSGQTVDAALSALFAAVAPWVSTNFPATTATLPTNYVLGANDPDDDWPKIAAMANLVVAPTRQGTVTVDDQSDGTTPVAVWASGMDHCAASKLSRSVKTSGIKNAVFAVTTSTDVVPPLTSTVMDTAPSSPTCVDSYGPSWERVESDTPTTQASLDAVALAKYNELRRPIASTQVTCQPRPDLEYRDLVTLGFDEVGAVGDYYVAGWTLRLPSAGISPELMTVDLMDRAL